MGSSSGSGQRLLALIADGDVDAAAGFYDAHAASVREYSLALCRKELVDDATLAAFIEFRWRAANAAADADAEEVLRRASRAAAAGRFDLRNPRSDACLATAELLAARMNGELMRGADALERHLRGCAPCRRTAERLTRAETALTEPRGDPPPEHVRIAWLELIGQEGVAERAVPAEAQGAGGNGAGAGSAPRANERPEAQEPELAGDPEAAPATEPGPAPATEPGPAPATELGPAPATELGPATAGEPPAASPAEAAPLRVRARRGGLLGAARRAASSARRHQ